MASINWEKVNADLRASCEQLSSNNLTKVKDALARVRIIYNAMTTDTDKRHISDKLIELHFVEQAKVIIDNRHVQNQPEEISGEILQLTLGLLHSTTNVSVAICEKIVQKELIPLVVREMKRSFLIRRLQNPFGGGNNGKIIDNCLGVLHNVVQMKPDFRHQVHTSELQELIRQLIEATTGVRNVFAIMALCIIVDNQCNTDILKVPKQDLLTIRKILKKAVQQTVMGDAFNQLMHGLVEISSAFSADETFQCLSTLVRNRENALELIKQGIIFHCEGFLEFAAQERFLQSSDVSPHSVNKATKWALRLLRRLRSSVPETAAILVTFQDTLSKFKDHTNDDIAQFASDLLLM